MSFKTNDTLWDTVKRFISGIFWQVPWLSAVGGGSWFVKQNLQTYLETYFDLFLYQKNAVDLQERTEAIQNTLSLTNPLRYADYISALSASTFASAKASTVEQAIHLISGLTNGILSVIWIIACIYAVIRVFKHVHQKTMENDIANQVVEKLLPILEDIQYQSYQANTSKKAE